MESVKSMSEKLPSAVPGVTIYEAFKGHNVSCQHISSLEYHSVIVEKKDKIKIEISIREPLLNPSESRYPLRYPSRFEVKAGAQELKCNKFHL